VYRDWRGVVYPTDLPQRSWFGYYVTAFDTVEINNTFYRLPPASTVEAWRDQAPAGFTYSVKVGQFGTHRKKLKDPGSWLARHLERAELLGDHLGPQLFQLPPRWRRDTSRLEDLLAAAPSRHRWAVEVRDPSWLHDDTYEVLARHDAALCLHDLVTDHPWERTASWSYVRFHGPDAVARPYRGRYTGRRLWRTAERLEAWLHEGVDVYAYFNNDYDGHAWTDARWLRDRLRP